MWILCLRCVCWMKVFSVIIMMMVVMMIVMLVLCKWKVLRVVIVVGWIEIGRVVILCVCVM